MLHIGAWIPARRLAPHESQHCNTSNAIYALPSRLGMLASLAGHAGLQPAVLHSCSVVHCAADSLLLQSPLDSRKDGDPDASITLGLSQRPISCASCACRPAPLHLMQLLGPSLLWSTGAVWEAAALSLTADTRCQLSAAVADRRCMVAQLPATTSPSGPLRSSPQGSGEQVLTDPWDL